MNNKFSAYWLFYSLGLAFWLICRNTLDLTLLCVFYSIFVGTVWGLVPKISKTEVVSLKYLIPPFMLIMLMMLSVRMRMLMSAEVVLITAMSLVHFRACILSFARLKNKAQIFSLLQFASFIFGLIFLFQKNILPFAITRNIFLVSMMAISTISIGYLIVLNRKKDDSIQEEIDGETVSS